MLELARCHICAALLPDEKEDRADHVAHHKHVDKRLDAMTASLRYLNSEIEAANARTEDLREQLAGQTAHTATTEGLVINEFPDDELDPDTGPEPVATEADLEPPFAELTTDITTDAADLHDITSTPDPTYTPGATA